MEFICPRCRGVSMKITSNIDLPPDIVLTRSVFRSLNARSVGLLD